MVDGKKMNKLNVLYEDNHLLVVEKPYNMPVQGDDSQDLDLLTLAKEYLKEKYRKPGNVYLGLVHRLDRPVGGIMVLARTSKAASRLGKMLQNHEFTKNYLAIVHGNVSQKEKLIDKIARDAATHNSYIDNINGKESILEYEKIAYNSSEDLSLIKINLLTGRHHQIRVQMAHRGNPLYGDNRYGLKEAAPICLFAYHLEFRHPVQNNILSFTILPHEKNKWALFCQELNKLQAKE